MLRTFQMALVDRIGIADSIRTYMSHSTKMKEFGGDAKNNTTYFIFCCFNLNSEHLRTTIHSFRQENSNNNKFRLILMAALIKNVIPITTTRNLIS